MTHTAASDTGHQPLTYATAVARLQALGHELATPAPLPDGSPAPRRKFDLDEMRTLAHALGDPQRTVPAILIAGTNGKGSTAATLASIFSAAGYRTGLYTSPHLIRVNERIQLSQAEIASEYSSPDVATSGGPATLHPIADTDFARLYQQVETSALHLVESKDLPQPPSFFEMLTGIAFLYFAERKADIAILEVGLGGRLDATNIVDPLLSILTDIALDHQEYLGSTIAAITREKCGILRPGGLLITLPQHPEANQAIGEAAAELGLEAISAAAFVPNQTNPAHAPAATAQWRNRYTVPFEGETLQVDSPLAGHHQQRNLALAIAAAAALRNVHTHKSGLPDSIRSQQRYVLSKDAIEAGISETRWPGRLELHRLPGGGPELLLDVAHNPAGAWTLRAAIGSLPEDRPRTLIFSCLADKDLTEMSRILLPLFDPSDPQRPLDHILFAPIDSPRAATVERLLAAAHALSIPAHAAPHVAAALAQAREITPEGGLIIATGSVYLIGELLAEIHTLPLSRTGVDA